MSPQPADRRPVTGRALLLALLAAVILVVASAAWSVTRAPGGDGATTVVMSDYAFSPSHLTWRVGERVTLTLLNDSQAQPPKPHEIMFGRGPRQEAGPFGPVQGDGFDEPLLTGVALDLEGGGDLTMLMAPGSELRGADPQSLLAPGAGGMGMGEMMDQFMAVFAPGGSLTFSFTVPDRPGEWRFGCFQQDGQHFLNGMAGTVTIRPGSSS